MATAIVGSFAFLVGFLFLFFIIILKESLVNRKRKKEQEKATIHKQLLQRYKTYMLDAQNTKKHLLAKMKKADNRFDRGKFSAAKRDYAAIEIEAKKEYGIWHCDRFYERPPEFKSACWDIKTAFKKIKETCQERSCIANTANEGRFLERCMNYEKAAEHYEKARLPKGAARCRRLAAGVHNNIPPDNLPPPPKEEY